MIVDFCKHEKIYEDEEMIFCAKCHVVLADLSLRAHDARASEMVANVK